ncbi:MAG: Clp protease N-terminal domain-containing protein, partial [Pseudobdellovibrionaceae bacterium]
MSNEIEKMTRKSQEAMQAAAQSAENRGNPSVEPEHLLLELLQQSEGIVPRLFEKQNLSVKSMIEDLKQRIEKFPRVTGGGQKVFASQRLQKLFTVADRVAADWGDSYISTEHFLLALFGLEDSDLNAFFKKHQIKHDPTVQALRDLRGSQKVTDDNPENKYEVLNKYARDLTALAAEGKLDPVVGRDEEIRRVIQVLSRRTKNNPVLIGEPGVGKTAIAEGL